MNTRVGTLVSWQVFPTWNSEMFFMFHHPLPSDHRTRENAQTSAVSVLITLRDTLQPLFHRESDCEVFARTNYD